MKKYDIIIRNGNAVLPEGIKKRDIGIIGEKIAAVSEQLDGTADQVIDASDMYVLPGGIDCHLHFNAPGHTDWENDETGSKALLAGGVTSYFDMPLNSLPVVTTAEAFDAKYEVMKQTSLADFGIWGGIVPGNFDELPRLAEKGVIGFKAFSCFSGLAEFPGADDYTVYHSMEICRELGLPVCIHCENDVLINGFAARLRAEGKIDAMAFLQSRPPITEIEPISRMVMFAKDTGCSFHVAHVSTPEGVEIVRAAREEGYDITCETVPQYLYFSAEQLPELGPKGKCCPPLRFGDTKDKLWTKLREGKFVSVCSDHSPAPDSLKTGDDFFKMWGGISGAQTALRSLLTAAHDGKISMKMASDLMGQNVAERWNLLHKGIIQVDRDADLSVIDMREHEVLKAEDLYYLHKTSAMVGMDFYGKVKATLLRGKVAYDGEFHVEPGYGKLIRPRV